MDLRALQFVRPARPYRELAILTEIGAHPSVSQRSLARAAAVSATLVNAYIDSLVERGWVEVSGETNRTYRYALTPEGTARRDELARDAAREIARFYECMKEEFRLLSEPPVGLREGA